MQAGIVAVEDVIRVAAAEAAGIGRAGEEVNMAGKTLDGIRVAILVTDNFEESELGRAQEGAR